MFSVIFEVNPKADQWDAYLGYAKLLRPELVKVDGFIDNFRYGSKRRDGWLLSLSTWRDEKALVRWRTHASHRFWCMNTPLVDFVVIDSRCGGLMTVFQK
jgi:heme-degrading monooxygenase HmoA